MHLKFFFWRDLVYDNCIKWQPEYLPENMSETYITKNSQEIWSKSPIGLSYQDQEELDFQSFWRDTGKIVLTKFWLKIMELARIHLQNIAQKQSGKCCFLWN